MTDKLRVVELFAGIGAQASALERLGIPFESIVCEIDPHAYNAYCAIHGPTPNLGDITKVEHLPDCDLLTYSFPCQDLSVAGCKRGMVEGSGTRSSLLWEVERLLRDARERERQPEVLLMENVDAILFKKNRPHLERFIIRLNELGYESSFKVLNAKDFGVPQNRNRCFMVSTLNKGRFQFPMGFRLDRCLRDVLETEVDESFYLSDEKLASYETHRKRHEAQGHGFGYRPIDPEAERERVAFSVTTKPDRNSSTFIIEHPKMEGQRESDLTMGEREAGLRLSGLLTCENYEYNQRVYDPDGIAPTVVTKHSSIRIEVEGDGCNQVADEQQQGV